MRNYYFRILMLFLTSVLAFSCGSEKKDAKNVADRFLSAYYGNRFQETYAISTESTQELIFYKEAFYSLNPYADEDPTRAYKIEKVVMGEVKDRAICYYQVEGESRKLYLTKVSDAKWMVDMNEEYPIEAKVGFSTKKDGGGFASAQSEPFRIADLKEEAANSAKDKKEETK